MLELVLVSIGKPVLIAKGEEGPSLAQALGINPLAIGPKQDDPAPTPAQAFKASSKL